MITYDFISAIRELHHRFGSPAPERPAEMPSEHARVRVALQQEEAGEFAKCFINGCTIYLPKAVHEAADNVIAGIGSLLAMGAPVEETLREVIEASARKVPPTEPGGKWVKPEGWTAADVRGVLERAGWKP